MTTAWGTASTLEGQVIKICDSVAYINHDIDDAIRAGVLRQADLPKDCLDVLGHSHGQRINTMVADLIQHNWWASGAGDPPDPPILAMSPPVLEATNALREFMFRQVYLAKSAEKDAEKVRFVIETLYTYFCAHFSELPDDLLLINRQRQEPVARAVVDYIAGMTDRYALAVFKRIFIPKTWGA
jgi:dGTPase